MTGDYNGLGFQAKKREQLRRVAGSRERCKVCGMEISSAQSDGHQGRCSGENIRGLPNDTALSVKARAIQDVISGDIVPAIAERYGVRQSTVWQWIGEPGKRRKSDQRKKRKQSAISMAVRLGVGIAAKRHGVHRTTVTRWLKAGK